MSEFRKSTVESFMLDNNWIWTASLDGSLECDGSATKKHQLQAIHKYEFRSQAGTTGWSGAHRDAALKLDYKDIFNASQGTINLWVSPLEDIGPWAEIVGSSGNNSGYKHVLISDTYPTWRLEHSCLGLYVTSDWHPGLMAKLMYGTDRQYFPQRAHVHTDEMPLRRGYWYQMAIGWDKQSKQIDMFVNGRRVNSSNGLNFADVGEALYFGSPFLVLADIRISDKLLHEAIIEKCFKDDLKRTGRPIDPHIAKLLDVTEPETLTINLDDYRLQTSMPLTSQDEVEKWVKQGPDYTGIKILKATSEGMLLETHESLDHANLCYLWSPESYEGDIFFRYEFKNELDTGLALVVFNASTMNRQDIIEHGDYPVTGSMVTICRKIRNYWWEYIRQTPPVRKHLNSHVLAKGPYCRPLGTSVTALSELNTWHELIVHKEGDRIRCGIDSKTIFDVVDSAFSGFGSSYNCGRIGLRHMQQTRVRYRNFEVYTREN
jgi:Domain of unknown function (DUF1961)